MMNYASAAAAQGLSQPTPELGRLKAVAERVGYAVNGLNDFIDRFHGPRPQGAGESPSPTVGGYRNDLDCVFAQLERLEAAIASLSTIG